MVCQSVSRLTAAAVLLLVVSLPAYSSGSRGRKKKKKSASSKEVRFAIERANAPLFAAPDGAHVGDPTMIFDDNSQSWVVLFSYSSASRTPHAYASQLGLSSSSDLGVSWQFHGNIPLPPIIMDES